MCGGGLVGWVHTHICTAPTFACMRACACKCVCNMCTAPRCVCVRARACVRACVRACMRACVRACGVRLHHMECIADVFCTKRMVRREEEERRRECERE